MRSRKIYYFFYMLLGFAFLTKAFLTFRYPPPAALSEVIFAGKITFFSPVTLRLFSFVVLCLSSLFFSKLVSRVITTEKFKNVLWVLSILIFFLSPWTNYIATYYPVENLILFFLLLAVYFFPKKAVFVVVLISVALTVYSAKTYPENIFFKSLSPAKLAEEINERQKIDYLATNKTYHLPAFFRKIIYNKPFYVINKSANHFISLVDFEQTISPLDSYAITKLSGLSPKSHPPLILFVELILIILGLFKLPNFNLKAKKVSYLWILLFSALPYFVMEKKLLAQSAILLMPAVTFLEICGISKLLTIKKTAAKIVLSSVPLIFIYSQISFNHLFYFQYSAYQTVHFHLYRQIAAYLNQPPATEAKIVITNRFGPTDKFISFYLKNKIPPQVTFRSFDLKKEKVDEETLYVGLPGEFVGRGKDLDEVLLPPFFKIIDKIEGGEEPVFDYGKGIWIGKSA